MSATNVQFSIALHLMAALAFRDGAEATSADLAQSVNTNASFLRKTLSKLAKSGLVAATRGKNGAYALALPAERITLLDVYRASDAPASFAIHDYPVEERCPISCQIKPCTASVLSEVQRSFEEALARKTLADVVAEIRARAE